MSIWNWIDQFVARFVEFDDARLYNGGHGDASL